jgi:hypothetical protein
MLLWGKTSLAGGNTLLSIVYPPRLALAGVVGGVEENLQGP